MVLRFIRKEMRHLQRIRPQGRTLLLTLMVYAACWPLVATFGNAYLWRRVSDPAVVMLFTMGMYLGIPAAFFANSVLLRRFTVPVLYGAGFLLLGISMFGFVVSGVVSPYGALVGGCVVGLSAGVYWVNRIILTLHLTHDRERDLFFALDSMVVTIMGVVMPLLFGVLIQSRFFIPDILDESISYEILLTVALFGFFKGAMKISRIPLELERPATVCFDANSNGWRWVHITMVARGLGDAGAAVIPVILPMILFGGEQGLGGLQSLVALVTAFVIYLIGRTMRDVAVRTKVLQFAVASTILGAGSLGLGVNIYTVLAFALFHGMGTALIWITINPIVYGYIETIEPRPEKWLAYICDRELFLGLGRIIGAAAFLIALGYGGEFALRWCALPFALAQLIVLIGATRVAGFSRRHISIGHREAA